MRILIDDKLTLTYGPSLSGTIEYIVLAGGEIEINGYYQMTNSTNLTVMPGGKISGSGTIVFTNASGEKVDYNGGEININTLIINCQNGYFYNAGSLVLNELKLTNNGTKLINNGHAVIGNVSQDENYSIDNGCYLQVENYSENINLGEN